ncbi:hypothetical protein CL634_01340 [bacterium]|nr:hypothetical protein [bacterium]
MSKSPSVLVAVGSGNHPKLPKQNYANIFTEYNISSLKKTPDSAFYNRVVRHPAIEGKTEFDIYGFMAGNCQYTYEDSIQQIVNFFNKHDRIEVAVCDIMRSTDIFKSRMYVQPQATNDIPFFVRKSVMHEINFTDEDLIFQNQLESLRSNHTIFHIASPLISTLTKGPNATER